MTPDILDLRRHQVRHAGNMEVSSKSKALGIAAGLVVTVSLLYVFRQNRRLRRQVQDERRRRAHGESNRTAEIGHEQTHSEQESTQDNKNDDEKLFVMKEIGVIQSVFPQRAGCPRQGTLAPHVKSLLVLHSHIPREVLDGILEYSHIWILFRFHLNPRGKARRSISDGNVGNTAGFIAAKVRPPRAPCKQGVLATRAPHRPNPIGLSLALLEDVKTMDRNGRKQCCVVLRGLDLVDGTPVYDIKPYIPWDRIPNFEPVTSPPTEIDERMKSLRVPSWVSADDELTSVVWSIRAREQIYEARGFLDALYGENFEEACIAIGQVIAQDPRAIWDGRGTLSREEFEFTFGELRICFVMTAHDETQTRSATVTSAIVDQGDLSSAEGSYPRNLALRRLAETKARKEGKILRWAYPVREGDTETLFDLENGCARIPRQRKWV